MRRMKWGGTVVVAVVVVGGDDGVEGVGTMLSLLYNPGNHVLEPTTVRDLLHHTYATFATFMIPPPWGEKRDEGNVG